MADIDNCDGSNYLRRACDAGTGGGGGGGGSPFNKSLTNGDGIGILNYDGSVARSIAVNSSVVRNTSDQVIAGGLTVEKLISNGPITGQGLDVSGVFTIEGDGSVGGSAPAATNVIAWDGSQWAPASAGGAASSSNLDLGYALDQSLRTSDEGQLSKLDVTGSTSLTSSGNVGIGTTNPSFSLNIREEDAANYAASSSSRSTPSGIFSYYDNNNITAGLSLQAFYDRATASVWYMGNAGSQDAGAGAPSFSGPLVIGNRDAGTAYSEKMRIDKDGNVGIGTTDPHRNLTVAGNFRLEKTAADGGDVALDFNVGGNSDEPELNIYDKDGSGVFRVGDGKVGIGTDDPSHNLDVKGTVQIENDGSSPLIQFTDTSVGSRWMGMVDGTKRFGFYASDGAAEQVSITDDGNVGVGNTDPQSTFVVGATDGVGYAATFKSAGVYGVNIHTEQAVAATQAALLVRNSPDGDSSNASTLFRVQNDGKVGIGTADPQTTLAVVASSSSSNGSQLRLSQGSASNKQFNIGYHTGESATQNVDYGKVEVYNASEPGGAKYMPLSLQPTNGSVVIGATKPQGLLGVSGDTYTQRLFITGAGGTWGQIGETLTGGDGINSFTYDALGGGEMGVSVDDTVLRTTEISQTILGDRNFTGTVTIGTLNVTGTQNIVSTDNLTSNGPTFTLNTGVGGVNSYDIGWVGERGSDLNIAVLWKEANDQFELISTSGISGGATNPSFSASGYKGLKVGHLTNTGQATVKTSTPMGDLSVSGSTYSEELYITGIDGSWERVGVQGHDQASSFNTPLSAGSSVYTINFPKTFGSTPVVNTTVQNSAGGAIIPHMISGVGVSSYSVVFGSNLPDANYSVNTSARPSAKTDDGTVTQSFSSSLSAGATSETIVYPVPFSSAPYVNVTIEGDGGSIVPYYISGVSTTNYDVVFGAPIPANYKIHTFAVR